MKKNEIALIILIVSIVAVAAYFLVGLVLPTPGKERVEVSKAEAIAPTVVDPNPAIFNSDAINPTVKVKIGDQSNQQPFTINQ